MNVQYLNMLHVGVLVENSLQNSHFKTVTSKLSLHLKIYKQCSDENKQAYITYCRMMAEKKGHSTSDAEDVR